MRLQRTVQLGTDALNKTVNTANAPTVYFGQNQENKPAAWRVIGYDGNGVAAAAGKTTLFAAENMGLTKIGSNAAYADSDLKVAIDALAGKLTAAEMSAVEKRTLESGSYDRENTDCVDGSAVNDAVFWPLSSKEANAVKKRFACCGSRASGLGVKLLVAALPERASQCGCLCGWRRQHPIPRHVRFSQ